MRYANGSEPASPFVARSIGPGSSACTISSPSNAAISAAADGKVHVDVGFWGGAVPGDLGQLRELHDAGVFGFKCFLCPSGVDEFGSLELDQLGASRPVAAERWSTCVRHPVAALASATAAIACSSAEAGRDAR